MTIVKTDVAIRLWKKVELIPFHECWEWVGSLQGSGYGQIWREDRLVSVHRVSWELHFGSVPNGLLVLHKCDNRSCVRPDHLFLGTNLDNQQDCKAKDRLGNRGRLPKERETHLDKATKLRIKEIYAQDLLTQEEIAKAFGITQPMVSYIVRDLV